jgi:hypothetical protein
MTSAFTKTIVLLAAFMQLAVGRPVAAERIAMPLGALVCKTIEPAIEHARLVRQPSTAGLRAFVEAQVQAGSCRVIKDEVLVTVVDLDQRGFALVDQAGHGQWWTDAENLWGYFDTPAKVKAWTKPYL